ncbi:hypothetical protein HDEF_1293 [Candidatus Hamiltonella defensa 5AT (Acyrthosiphon pisum)]|uniref:Uncharacterized protein n=1 Tax=Hamiltonella defensa subsp. Acyrthosiphon pisum (strain 5AT) TaxID=572265 RepID=C4K5V2_HAMD5|nr:hypothetical protein HDEF_1293 [Candidatus Hamiltonella defensa 5AT (Acyrthosiphon pisum)]
MKKALNVLILSKITGHNKNQVIVKSHLKYRLLWNFMVFCCLFFNLKISYPFVF